ncbi:F-box/FBD/LRR-repeat protein At1g13570-like [Daucus carota subsp. sativus]|uniref:F-box/FBD/LRR-repeat protein At1g13570-like n=1 Tax=Daucus carota subsp. sativus TaxID=79200 RepID=UPI003083D4FC
MAAQAKTRRYENGTGETDRISHLPPFLIDEVLERLWIHDAARTSILSKTWRHIWEMHPNLHLNYKFITQLVTQKFAEMDEQTQMKEISKTISNIFLSHSGPILSFFLYIPRDLPFHESSDLILWIKNISNKGVETLTLRNESPVDCKIPSYFFSCVQLTDLGLEGCVLNPPLGFTGFSKLIRVDLKDVTFSGNMSFGTQVQDLRLHNCRGIEHLGRQFKPDNNLTALYFLNSDVIDWRWFECTYKLQYLRIVMSKMPSSTEKVINLDKLLGNMPRLDTLWLEGFVYREQSGNAEMLLDPSVFSDHMILDQLETLKVINMVASPNEFQLIRLLLASSPSLKSFDFNTEYIIHDPAEELMITQEVRQIPRASRDVVIEWIF